MNGETFVLKTLFPGTFVPMMELSFSGPFVPWNIRSLDHSFPGTFVPGTLDLSCHWPFIYLSAKQYLIHLQRRNSITNRTWTFPVADHSFIYQQSSTWSTYKEGTGNKQKRRLMTATVYSRYTQTVDRRYSVSHLNWFSSSERGLLNNSFGALHCQKNAHYECMRHLQIKR